MSMKVEASLVVNVPRRTAYQQWTNFESFPAFMGGIERVSRSGGDRLQWVARFAGIERCWEALILEQVPDQTVAWAATEGPTNAGTVLLEDYGPGQTLVHLSLQYEAEGLVETFGETMHVAHNRAMAHLDRYKALVEGDG